MAYFSQDFIEEVLDRNDIVDIISTYLPLKRKGNSYWGLCPFHGEKTPSFSVNANQQFYHCFGCHVGGDAINFVQKVERLDFQEAVIFLAERARLSIPKSSGKEPHISSDKKELMYSTMKEAARWYRSNLNAAGGKVAKAYIAKRGISETIIKRFGIGYAPDKWNDLMDYLVAQGSDKKLLHIIGLTKEKNKSYYDTFRNRMMFPIIDKRQRVVGFGGRVMDDSQPKYLNSPETPIFNKRYNLYGVHTLNKIKTVDKIMIVEGYMDVISLHQAGFTQVLASLGTALTQGQAKLMKRYTKEIYICYDGDTAGQNATLKGLDIMQAEGLNVKVISMPTGMDPDDFAKQYGIVGIQDEMTKAVTLNDYKISIIEQKYDMTQEEERKMFLQECCKSVLAHIDTPIELAMYEKRLHTKTGFPIVAIDAETQMAKKALGKMNRPTNNRDNIDKTINIANERNISQRSAANTGLVRAERIALQLAIADVDCRKKLFKEISPKDFSNEARENIGEVVYKLDNKKTNIGKIITLLNKSDVVEIGQEQMDLIIDFDAAMDECISKIKQGIFKAKRRELIAKINDVNTPKDEKKQYMLEVQQIDKQQKGQGTNEGED